MRANMTIIVLTAMFLIVISGLIKYTMDYQIREVKPENPCDYVTATFPGHEKDTLFIGDTIIYTGRTSDTLFYKALKWER